MLRIYKMKKFLTVIFLILPVAFATGVDQFETIQIGSQQAVLDENLNPITNLLTPVKEGVSREVLVNRLDLEFYDTKGNIIKRLAGQRLMQFNHGLSLFNSSDGPFAVTVNLEVIPLDEAIRSINSKFGDSGFAIVTLQNGKRNYLNTNLKVAFPEFDFDSVRGFTGNYSPVEIGKKKFLLSMDGELIEYVDLDLDLDYLSDSNFGLYVFSRNKKEGLADSVFNLLLPPRYNRIRALSSKLVIVEKIDLGLESYNLETEKFSPLNFERLASSHNEDVLIVYDSEDKCYLLSWNSNEEEIITYGPYKSFGHRIGRWTPFVKLDGTKGYISDDGQVKILDDIEEKVRKYKY